MVIAKQSSITNLLVPTPTVAALLGVVPWVKDIVCITIKVIEVHSNGILVFLMSFHLPSYSGSLLEDPNQCGENRQFLEGLCGGLVLLGHRIQ